MQTNTRKHTLLAGTALALTTTLLMVGGTLSIQAQTTSVLYGKYNPAAAQEQIWVSGTNGSNAQHLMSSLLQASSPVESRDGRYIVVTGQAPLVERQSFNLYLLDRVTGKVSQVTHNIDTKYADGSVTYYVADSKAFSPDGKQMVVTNYAFSTDTIGVFLYVVNTNGIGVPITVASKIVDGVDDAHGVDWSPVADLVVVGFTNVSTAYGIPMTLGPLYLVSPVANAAQLGKYRQLTFPRGSSVWDVVDDLLPAFSPDGKQVAFVRKSKTYTYAGFGPSTASIYIINTDGTNLRRLYTFPTSTVVNSHMSWSADGKKLLFDVGTEIHTGGGYIGIADPHTTMLWTINVDGTGLARLPIYGAAPSWNR